MKKTKLSHLLYAEEMRALTLATMQEHIEAWDFDRAIYWQLRYLAHTDESLALRKRHEKAYWQLRFAVLGEKF